MAEARKRQKRQAKQQRQLIFRVGGRVVFLLEALRRCLCILRFLLVAWITYAALITIFAVLRTCLRSLQTLYLVCIILSHVAHLCADLCILHLLLQIPLVRDFLAELRCRYQHFVLVVVAVAGDSLRGFLLFVLWLCDFHFRTSMACECFSMLVYVAATIGSHSSVLSVYSFAILGFVFPVFPPKSVPSQVHKKPSVARVLKKPSAVASKELPWIEAAASEELPVFEIRYKTGNTEKRYSFAKYYFTVAVLERANEFKTFLLSTQLFQSGYWIHHQFEKDVVGPLNFLLFPQYKPNESVFVVRRRIKWDSAVGRLQSEAVTRFNYFKISLCIDDLLFKAPKEAPFDELKLLATSPEVSSLYVASVWASDSAALSSEVPLLFIVYRTGGTPSGEINLWSVKSSLCVEFFLQSTELFQSGYWTQE